MRTTATATVHVRVNPRVKAKAEKALAAMGLSVSDAVRVLLHRVAEDKAFPFALEVPNAETRAAMAELERGGGKSFETLDDLFADLRSDDAKG
jgi:DNA-damage-inducible protein J